MEIYRSELGGGDDDLPEEQVDWVHNLLGEIGADEVTDQAARAEYDAFRVEMESAKPRAEAVADLEALALFTLERDR